VIKISNFSSKNTPLNLEKGRPTISGLPFRTQILRNFYCGLKNMAIPIWKKILDHKANLGLTHKIQLIIKNQRI
jgi:hypothetical protein